MTAQIVDTLAKDVERSALFDLAHEPFQEAHFHLLPVPQFLASPTPSAAIMAPFFAATDMRWKVASDNSLRLARPG